jgi:TolB-like protein
MVRPKVPRRRLWAVLGLVGAALALIAFAIGLNVGGWRDRLLGLSTHPRIQSLAVLPLENLSRDPDQEYFADGMTDELTTDLAKIGSLRVISRTSAMHYKGTKKTLPEIARELNVDAVVEGTVQRSGDHVLISAQLIHAPSDRHLWAESYDRDLRDVLALESEVARAIASEIQAKVTPQEQARLASARTVNPEAHELFLKAEYYLSKNTPEGNTKAFQYLQQAIGKDPNYALAYAGLARCYKGLEEWEVLGRDASLKAEGAARHALQLDETVSQAHALLGWARWQYDWDWPGAEREFRRAIELNPNLSTPHHLYEEWLSFMGRHDEAIIEIRKAESLNPLSLSDSMEVGAALYYARLYDQAIAQELKTLEMDPSFAFAHLYLGNCYAQKGLNREALAEFQKAADLSRTKLGAEAGYTYARMGRTAEALKMVNEMKAEFHQSHPTVGAGDIAPIYAGLGDKDQALAWLEKSYEKHESYPVLMKVDPMLDLLRSDPRFQDLVRRMHFPE